MDETAFIDRSTGQLIPTLSGRCAFVPAPLPPKLDMTRLIAPMTKVMRAIGELSGACRRLQNPYILIRPLQRSEALTSSAMEGTFSTDDELLLAEAGINNRSTEDTKEVVNYIHALNTALKMLDELPLSHRVIKSAHRQLLTGLSHARGAQKRPGEYKSEQNWIGGPTIDKARFVPPPPAETQVCMDELEKYLNRDNRELPDILLDLALVHYQIETIHPFADGNGRIGRMLVSIMAVQSGLLAMPVLYVSPSIENRKNEYIDLMFKVSAKGAWTEWIEFFFARLCETCDETIATVDRLIALHEAYRARAQSIMRSASAVTIVDFLFERPIITVTEAATKLSVTYPAAKKAIDRLVENRILVERSDVYPKVFIAPEIVRAARPSG